MALSYFTGFEHNVISTSGGGIISAADTAGNGSVVTSPVKNGTYALKVDGAIGGGGWYWTISNSIYVQSGWYQFPDVTKVGYVVRCQIPGTRDTGVRTNASGQLELYDSVSGVLATATTAIANNTWFYVELLVDAHANPNAYKWRVNGIDQGDVSLGVAARTWTQGMIAGVNSGTVMYADDVHIYLGAATDYPVGMKAVVGITLDQTAAAEHQSITTTQWDYTDNFSTFSNFASQAETDSRSRLNTLDTANGIRMNNAAAVAGNARWPLASLPANVAWPYAVRGLFSGREASAGTNNAIVRLYLGGSTTDLFNADPSWGTTWNYIAGLLTTKPGGGAWTVNDVNSLRLEVDSTDASPNVWLGGLVVEVSTGPPSLSFSPRTNRNMLLRR